MSISGMLPKSSFRRRDANHVCRIPGRLTLVAGVSDLQTNWADPLVALFALMWPSKSRNRCNFRAGLFIGLG